MFQYAGVLAKITKVTTNGTYKLNIDDGEYWWADWMFDPDYKADGPLSAEDAIQAMLDGETLYTEDGYKYRFNKRSGAITRLDAKKDCITAIQSYTGLYRRPAKRKRLMTQEEARKWAESKDSLGWMVRWAPYSPWTLPRHFLYTEHVAQYQRARLRSDLSGVDEDTICEFEVDCETTV
jgi:hypothetical protein